MKIVVLTIVTMYFTLMVSAECASSQDLVWSDELSSDERERSFETPDDLRSHLDSLSNYYAVVGRPRFGVVFITPSLRVMTDGFWCI